MWLEYQKDWMLVDIDWVLINGWLCFTWRWFYLPGNSQQLLQERQQPAGGCCSRRCRGRQLHHACSLLHLPLLLLLLLHPYLLLLHLPLAAEEEEATYKLTRPTTHHVLCPTESRDALKHKVCRKTNWGSCINTPLPPYVQSMNFQLS